jgi:hypothetical protein
MGANGIESAQVAESLNPYAPHVTPVPDDGDRMLPWIAKVCREARLAAGRRQVHIAVRADVDQSTVNRFETVQGWPRDVDRMIAAYGEDLGISSLELWRRAADAWRTLT